MKVSVEGEMAEYVKVQEKEIRFIPEDDAKRVDFAVNLPRDVPPGESSAYIIFEESLGALGENEVASKIVLKHKILIQGPYPDKYIGIKLNFHERDESYELVAEVDNLGKKDLQEVKTTFFINDKEQKERSLETETVSLKTKETKLLSAQLEKSALTVGEFEVLAITSFDDQKIEAFKKLLVGRPEVEVVYFDKYFIANKINEYSLDLLNKWNKPVENVYVDVEVKKDNQKIDQFRTKSVDIDAEVIKRITDYFDARDKGPGVYMFEMAVNFWNTYRMQTKTFRTEFLTEEEAAKGAERTEEVTASAVSVLEQEEKESGMSGGTIAVLAIVIAAIIGISIFAIRRTSREEGDHEFN